VHRDVLHGRGQIWAAGVRAFERRPLQGYGAGSFLAATADLQRPVVTSYGHDLPLELGVELGVAGALLGLALYVLTARAWWRARHAAGVWLVVVPALAFLTANLVDWPWHVGGIGAVWAAVTASLIAAGSGIAPGRWIASRPSTARRAVTERCK
jgi:O-antigen ligase